MILKFGTLEIPLLAALDIEQTYPPIGGEALLRTVSGAGIKQMTWRKTRIVTTGSGWLPAGLDTLDTAATLAIACVVPRTVPAVFATRQATLPAARRSDSGHLPWGVAVMPDNSVIVTPATMAGNVATLDAVANAVSYKALYLPLITCWAMRPTDSGTPGDASYRLEITAEEA
mgnify:FL=1